MEIRKSKDYELGYCRTTLMMKTSFSDAHIPKDEMETIVYREEMISEIRSQRDFFKGLHNPCIKQISCIYIQSHKRVYE